MTALFTDRLVINYQEQPVIKRTTRLRMSDIVAALSYALDITEGQPEGHAVRSCMIGMRIADEIDLDPSLRQPLFYALLLKDLGCSSNAARVVQLLGHDDFAAKQDMKTSDWSSLPAAAAFGLRNLAPDRSLIEKAIQLARVGVAGGPFAACDLFQIRCDRGASIAQMLGFPPATAEAIRALDEHWDGHGYPARLRAEKIPLLGRILCLAQTVDIFRTTYGSEAAFRIASQRSGRWFDPQLVAVLKRFQHDSIFWQQLNDPQIYTHATALEPGDLLMTVDDQQIDTIAEAFAQVIDAKSPWTFRHSTGVATIAVGIATIQGWDQAALQDLRRAALLHDIGKLGVSNQILDKQGPLSTEERQSMQQHVLYTAQLLERVPCFQHLAATAAAHHERLDGKGYLLGLKGAQLNSSARILAVADLCDALSADRPYRRGMQPEQVLQIAQRDAGVALCQDSVEALTVYLQQVEP